MSMRNRSNSQYSTGERQRSFSINAYHALQSNIREAKDLVQKQDQIDKEIMKYKQLTERSEKNLLDTTRKMLRSTGRFTKNNELVELPDIVLSTPDSQRSKLPSLSTSNMNLILCTSPENATKHKMYPNVVLPSVVSKPVQKTQPPVALKTLSEASVIDKADNPFPSKLSHYSRSTAGPGIVIRTRSYSDEMHARRVSEPAVEKAQFLTRTMSNGRFRSDSVHPLLSLPEKSESEVRSRSSNSADEASSKTLSNRRNKPRSISLA